MLGDRLDSFGDRATVWKNATAIGFYEDGVITVDHDGVYKKVKPESASSLRREPPEKFLSFPNNDLPRHLRSRRRPDDDERLRPFVPGIAFL